jgi:hypothetical protein
MQVTMVLTAVTYRYSSALYDWRRDSRFRVTVAVFDDGSAEVPARPPMSVHTRHFESLEAAKLWARELHRVEEDDWIECRMPRFLKCDPTEPPAGGPVR